MEQQGKEQILLLILSRASILESGSKWPIVKCPEKGIGQPGDSSIHWLWAAQQCESDVKVSPICLKHPIAAGCVVSREFKLQCQQMELAEKCTHKIILMNSSRYVRQLYAEFRKLHVEQITGVVWSSGVGRHCIIYNVCTAELKS